MTAAFKDAITLCKSIMRNGFDAHIVNMQLQHELLEKTDCKEIDIATDMPLEELQKLFPALHNDDTDDALGMLTEEEMRFRFYRMHFSDSANPENILTRLTPTIINRLSSIGKLPPSLLAGMNSLSRPEDGNSYTGFDNFDTGSIKLEGLPDETLQTDYLLGIRALRHSANYDLPIEPNTWMAIVRASKNIVDYVPPRKIMFEWRKVEAESMAQFVMLMYRSTILHGILPEIAFLSRVKQLRNDSGKEETVFDHTVAAMKAYPEGEFHYDWLGTFALLFHEVGKLYTAEHYNNRWYFFEHHKVGSEVTRKILRRLQIRADEIDLICRLVRNHMRFEFMMTDKGIRRFKAQGETARLIEFSRAKIVAREDNYTAFNHNTKYLKRAETPEQMLEPLLNGNEIMEETSLAPGPHVGEIRQSLLKAQIEGKVNSRAGAIEFVKEFAKNIAGNKK